MREIKFRAWDNILNKMVSVEHVVWKDGEIVQILAGGIIVIEAALKRFDLMQYIGTKDCNGKEIYGGDIVKILNTGYIYKIYWSERFCGFYLLGNQNYKKGRVSSEWASQCEIIGNKNRQRFT